jgi:hypothetical protein
MTAAVLKTPVIFLVFNRPSTTSRVFEVIRRARPAKLLVIADGPRSDRPGEVELCNEARKLATHVDWPCDLSTRFSIENLGCRLNVSSGLDWAFDQIEKGIILEDDCLPDPTFFPFCEELLERYRDNPSIAQISGSNFQQGIRRTEFSYYFSRHAHCWGWATWRRSWRHNDLGMAAWPQLREQRWLDRYLCDSKAAFYWRKIFDDSYKNDRNSLNSWAVPWTFSCWARGALSINPEVNLVLNIGHSATGTHTKRGAAVNRTPVGSIQFPLRHPSRVEWDVDADRFTEQSFYYGQNLLERLFWTLRVPLSLGTARRLRRWPRLGDRG